MSSLIGRGVSVYQDAGAAALLNKAAQKIHRETLHRLLSFRGEYSLSVSGHRLVFSAPSTKVVARNRMRFNSEQCALQDFITELRPDDVVYDVGANTGLYTLFAATASSDGKTIAFEPYPPNIEVLKQDAERNHLRNVDIVDVALSDAIGTVGFSQPNKDDVGYGSSSIEADGSTATIEVPTTTGDQLVADEIIPLPNVVKIDVEGAEPLVIEGLTQALSSPSCRTVYCEVHLPGVDQRPSVTDFGSSADDIKSRLQDLGFAVTQLYERNNEIFYKGHK